MQEESFQSRYVVKILSSIVIAVLNVVIQMLLPRALSVEEFGYYSYNLNVFTSTVVLANLSMSNALVAKFSKRNDEIGLVCFYLKYYFFEIIILSLGLLVLYPIKLAQNTFSGQTILMTLLGLEAAAVIKFLSDVVSIYDAMAIAKCSAVFQIILKILVCIFVIASYFCGKLNLSVFYMGQIVLTFGIASVLLMMVLKYQKNKYQMRKADRFFNYVREYTIFCKPLVISNIVSQVIIIIMNWCLMRFSGVTGQAIFGAAWQLNALVTYVFSPYAEISKREYSVVSGDIDKLKGFYCNSLKRMFWLTAYFACFIGFCNDWILNIVYGDKYSGAGMVTLLIMLYTIYQAWGQMCGSFMLATEKTKMNAVLGIIGQIVTLVLVFIFQIPNVIWPSGLGAIGIALVYVVGNFISVSISIIATTRVLKMNSLRILSIQILPMLLCSGVSFMLNYILNTLILGSDLMNSLLKLFVAGVVYTIVIVTVVWIWPSQIAMSRKQLLQLVRK